MTNDEFQVFLEAALKRLTKAPPVDEVAVARVMARLTTLPRQKLTLRRLPAVLLDWQFAPAWPRLAALTGCLALGFLIGLAGLDRRIDHADAQFAVATSADIGTVVFEPEPLTGARP